MRIEWVSHGEDDIKAEEEVEGEGDVLEELQDVEVGGAEHA